MDSKQIERAVRVVLEEDGHKLYAYQKIPATAAGTFHLIAEYEDSLIAQEATRKLDRRIIAVSLPPPPKICRMQLKFISGQCDDEYLFT